MLDEPTINKELPRGREGDDAGILNEECDGGAVGGPLDGVAPVLI
jgi:hypothetical protein